MIAEKIKPYQLHIYFIFRVLVGLLFVQHGAQKLFGAFGGLGGNSVFGGGVEIISLMALAGTIELLGGLAIALGVFTRLAALIAALEMVVAYIMVHVSQGFFPFVNKGELVLLYIVAFLVLIAWGAGKWSLEQTLMKKELF